MGAIEDLAAALTGPQVQQQIAAENPYLNLARTPDAIPGLTASLVAKNPGQYGWGESVGTGLVSGLLSGLLHGQGDIYSGQLNDRYLNAAKAYAQDQTPDPNAYLPPSLLTDARNATSMFKLRDRLENAQLDTNANRQVASQLAVDTNPDLVKQKLILSDVAAGNLTADEALAKLGQQGAPGVVTAPLEGEAAPSSLEDYARVRGVKYEPGMTRKTIQEIASDNMRLSQPLPEGVGQEFDAVQRAKESAASILPMVKKLEDSLTPEQRNLSWLQIKAKQLLPANDITLIEQEMGKLAGDLANANPKGRVPMAEIENLKKALASDIPLASAISSDRIKRYTDQITSGFRNRLDTYDGTTYGKSANSILSKNADLFQPLTIPQQDPASFIAELRSKGTDAATAKKLYEQKFGAGS